MKYDVLVIGSGPGGYVAAIRGSQLGMKAGVVEQAELGGVCLNWGCIPTKSLLKSALVYQELLRADEYGITCKGNPAPDLAKMVSRSRDVANSMSKGVQFLFKKNKIDHISGRGKITGAQQVEVETGDGKKEIFSAEHIILATGARTKELPDVKPDGKKIIGYREALTLTELPTSMIVVGSGAIGSEFAYFYHTLGCKVTLVEFLPYIIPLEDPEISKTLERSFKKSGMNVMTNAAVKSVTVTNDLCKVKIKTSKGVEEQEAEIILSAAGITPNLENIGIEELGVELQEDKIRVDEYYRTNIAGVYAIGDIVHGPALAHVASAEGIICVENIAGTNPQPLDYGNIPACTYTTPEVASVGYNETEAEKAGYDVRVGKFPFTASGKANAAGHKDGFVKLIFDAKYGELLGAHMIGDHVTEMIAEIVVARKLETTGREMIKSVHPHPTMSEAIMEAAAAAFDEAIHL